MMNHLTKVLLSCLIALWLSPSTALAQSVLYVDASAGGSDDGTSWTNAYTSLQDAIAASASGDEIWVAAGTYKPSAYPTGSECVSCSSPRDYTFLLKNGVKLYGGFAGTEAQLSERNISVNVTNLSGDIGTVGSAVDNVYHVLLSLSNDSNTVLDGFTVSGGNANEFGGRQLQSNFIGTSVGGGMYNQFSSPSITNTTFTGNYAMGGGGMYNASSSPNITNTTFTGNSALDGGGMHNESSSPDITNSTFSGNSAINNGYGGGMYNQTNSSPSITKSTFIGNSASNSGGGMYNLANSSPSINNSTFSGNSASSAGSGMFNADYSSPSITNTTFSGNSGSAGAGVMYNLFDSSPIITNSILWGNGTEILNASSSNATVSYSIVQGGYTGTANLDVDPLFVNAANGDFSLQIGSPAINTGSDTAYQNATGATPTNDTDLAGNPRVVNSVIDMGAFENPVLQCPSSNVIYVNANANGNNTGTSWNNAFKEVQSALASTCPNITEIWVAAGTYKPTVYPTSCSGCNSPRDYTFLLKDGVKLYGGFAGTETALSQRDVATNTTILSGDIGAVGDVTDNVHHVVLAVFGNATPTSQLDGFSITGGNANGTSFITVNGADIYRVEGAGLFARNGTNRIMNNKVHGNLATGGGGGGMYLLNGVNTLANNSFDANSAFDGGGIYLGGLGVNTLANNTIAGNSGAAGGGMYTASGTNTLVNNIIWGNSGASVFNDPNLPSTNTVTFSIVQGGIAGEGNLNTDPLFTDAANGDFSLQLGSSAINSGSNTAYQNATGNDPANDTDLTGNARLFGSTIDMGAYERELPCPPSNIIYVDANASGNNTGISWSNAYTNLQRALENTCPNITEIWVAAGTYKPTAYPTGCSGCNSPRDYTFLLKDGVKLYGGFAGTETTLSERNFSSNTTILSGDIGAIGDATDNVHHVVLAVFGNATPTTQLDGFSITGGNANGTSFITVNGADIYRVEGAGLFARNGTNRITNNKIYGNLATGGGGGGIYLLNGVNTVANNSFYANSAFDGGGIYLGGLGVNTLANNTIAGNSGAAGGGMYTASGTNTLVNNIIWGNSGASIFNDPNLPSTNTVTYSIVQGGITGLGNLNVNPQFTDAANGDFTLQVSSPAFNSGSNTAYQNATGVDPANGTDLAGSPRLFGNTIDMGAFEIQQLPCPQNNILYVNTSASGNNDGTSWSNAYTDLQDALNSSCPNVAEIWLAAGTYYPDEGVGITDNDRSATFQLKNGVALYGGFTGTETQLSERDWENNPTILSGDINQSGTLTGNSYNVVTGSGNNNTAALDGFTITKGNADGSTDITSRGAGMLSNAGSPSVSNCVFLENSASQGGGMYNENYSSPVLTNVLFLSNIAGGGGGMSNNNNSSPIITNSRFVENEAAFGGGVYNNNFSSPIIKNSVFSGNASADGGGMYNNNHSSPSITNSSFIGNYNTISESSGGGMYNRNSSNPNIANSLFSGNSTGEFGGGLFNSNSNPILTNTIIWNNAIEVNINATSESIYNSNNSSSTISYSLIANSGGSGSWDSNIGTDGGNNIDANPQFTDAANGDFRLQSCSPAINAGSNAAVPSGVTTDLDGNPRFSNNGTVDMGAYEFQDIPATAPTGTLAITNSTCTDCMLSGGSIVLGTVSGTGGTLEYSTDNGETWSSALPTYDQDGPAQTILASVLSANGCRSAYTQVGETVPGECVTPDAPTLAITDNTCPSSDGAIAAMGCGTGTVAEYATGPDGPWSATPPAYSTTAFTVYARCRDEANGCISGTGQGTTSPTDCPVLSGTILWEHDRTANPIGVPDAAVALTGDDTGSDNTDMSGGYAIPTVGGNSLTLTPTKTTGDAYEGVDAADVTRIQQHVTFIDRLDDGYKVIAADVNQSNSVTGLDAAVIFHSLNGNSSAQTIFETPAWRFVEATHTFMDENAPWTPAFPEDISLTNVMANVVDQDFVGVKMGDVNGTWNTPIPLLLAPALNWAIPDAALTAGQTLRIPFRANGLPDVAAWQFALRFDTDYLRFERALPTAAFPLKDENFGAWQADRGELRSVFAVPQGRALPKDEVLFELEFQVVYDGLQLSEVLSLDDGILDGRVYNTALNGGAVALAFEAVETRRIASLLPGEAALDFALEQNIPNPFGGETLIRFQLPEAGEAVFSVHDVQGRLLYEQRGFFGAGQHEARLDAAQLGATGVLSYTLRTGAHSATRRMVLVR